MLKRDVIYDIKIYLSIAPFCLFCFCVLLFSQFSLFFCFLPLSLSLCLSLVCVLLPMWCCKIKLVWCFFLLLNFCCYCFVFFSLQTSVIVFFGGCEKKVGLVSVAAVVVVVCVCMCVSGGVFFFLGVHLCRLFCNICLQKFMLCVFPSMLARKWWRRWWFCDDGDDGSMMKMMMVLPCTREWASRGIGILCDGGYGHGFQE